MSFFSGSEGLHSGAFFAIQSYDINKKVLALKIKKSIKNMPVHRKLNKKLKKMKKK